MTYNTKNFLIIALLCTIAAMTALTGCCAQSEIKKVTTYGTYSVVTQNNGTRDKKYGVQDNNKQKLVLPIVYDDITLSSYYDEKTDTRMIAAAVSQNGKAGLLDIKSKQFFIPMTYDKIEYLKNDHYAIVQNKKYGIYSIKSKKITIPPVYDFIEPALYLEFGAVIIYKNGKSGIIAIDYDEILVEPILTCINKYYIIVTDNDILVRASSNGSIDTGLYSVRKKKFLIDPSIYKMGKQYLIKRGSFDYVIVKKGNKQGLFDVYKSEMIIEPKYSYVDISARGDKLIVLLKNGSKIGLGFFPSGKILEPQFDKLCGEKNGIITLRSQGTMYDYDLDGNLINKR